MKQELLQLAKDKGFIATFVHDKPFIYSSKEPLRWLFWMTELQKWLRDIHKIDIQILRNKPGYDEYKVEIYQTTNSDTYFFGLIKEDDEYIKWFKVYETALEVGLFESLKLIKDE